MLLFEQKEFTATTLWIYLLISLNELWFQWWNYSLKYYTYKYITYLIVHIKDRDKLFLIAKTFVLNKIFLFKYNIEILYGSYYYNTLMEMFYMSGESPYRFSVDISFLLMTERNQVFLLICSRLEISPENRDQQTIFEISNHLNCNS